MDNIRVFLWLTLLGLVWLTYTAWNADYGGAPNGAVTAPPVPTENGVPAGELPSLNPAADVLPQTPEEAAAPPAPATELIRVRTDVLDVHITSQGGDLVRADLLEYSVRKDMPEPVVRLLDDSGPERWVFESGLRSAVGGACDPRFLRLRTVHEPYDAAQHAVLPDSFDAHDE